MLAGRCHFLPSALIRCLRQRARGIARKLLWAAVAVMVVGWGMAGLTPATAGPLRDLLRERVEARRAEPPGEGGDESAQLLDLGGGGAQSCAEWGAKVARLEHFARGRNHKSHPDLSDLAYGPEPLQTLDVYFGAKQAVPTGPAPILVMVHGGGWCVGDKAGDQITANKVAHWGPRGFVFVSVNYPMVAEGSDALAQARHVARAVAFVQAQAAQWGGDPQRVILLGHSAGAHLVSLVNADAALRRAAGVAPLLGTVSLDAGAIDVVRQMPRVYPFLKLRYQEAFGTTESQWIAASPYHQLGPGAAPWLGVCSTTRKDDPCGQARSYAEKSLSLGIAARVLPENLNHGAINQQLGLAGAYTEGVDDFLASLDPQVASRLR